MNLFISTAKVIRNPRLYRSKQKVFLKMNIVFLKRKKKVYLRSAICVIKGRLAIHMFDILNKDDIIFIEGYIKIKFLQTSNNNKNIKIVTMQAKKIYNLRKMVERIV
uniref:hypothetical protein n=1 Tax=Hypnea musciformis TaxID=31429 RepID=UPI0027DAA86D|nr:hypothetical protein REP96_pgp119 [Hypnea musciformis]WCH56907.1 hypothetical protein [Hypnea musciformis]